MVDQMIKTNQFWYDAMIWCDILFREEHMVFVYANELNKWMLMFELLAIFTFYKS